MGISRGRRAAPLPEQGAPRRVRVRLEHIRRVECEIASMPFHGEHVTADMPGLLKGNMCLRTCLCGRESVNMPFEGESVVAVDQRDCDDSWTPAAARVKTVVLLSQMSFQSSS